MKLNSMCAFLCCLILFSTGKAFTQHKIFLSKNERGVLIKRLEKDLKQLYGQPPSFQRDTILFRKLDTFYVQWSQLNTVLKPMLAKQSILTDSLFKIANRNKWEEGIYFSMKYKSQKLAFGGKVDSAYALLLDIQKGYERLSIPYQQAWILIALAEKLVYREIKTPEEIIKAIHCLEKAITIGEKYKIWEVIHKANAHIGDIYSMQGDYKKALVYFEKQIPMFKKHGDINLGYYSEGTNYANLGICYLHLGNEKEAVRFFYKFYGVNNPDFGGYANYVHHAVLLEYSSFFIKKNMFNKALEFEQLYTKILPERNQNDYATHYKHLYEIYKGLLNYKKGLYYFEKWQETREKLKTENLSNEFKKIESLYQLEKKNNEIEDLRKLSLEKEIEEQRNTNIAIVILFVSIFLILVLVFRSINFKRAMVQAKFELSEQNQKLSQQIIQTQDSEQQRIAADLHDDLGGTIATVNAKLSQLVGAESISQIKHGIVDTLKISAKAGDQIRQISHNLMPPDLEKVGLVLLIQERIVQLNENEKPQFRCLIFGTERRLSLEKELNIYRILSELIHNIQKHAQAKTASVQFFFHEDILTITVEDDGVGDTLEKNREKSWGIGLKNVFSRVNYLHARLHTDSSEQGTTIILEVPYDAPSQLHTNSDRG
ncbi:tetratricopeptide repeat-containing sensor histidine kinase [Runella aurantiaca]|uniref:histidine kinase n=1 Tax=Runella aurantiaca TaxID=2282308 RepID=A0A369IAK7_9BACT|nr:tetratricopeptide repeat-containing sensor histidine kinase [Runella aurantiaca]RDB05900.1 hypothetical protein DVG78_10850 [Runella aurantiaca]